MSVQSISAVKIMDLPTIHKILSSTSISERQKETFVKQNASQIKKVFDENISVNEFKFIINCRPLQKFKPIKNSLTKRGDRILLAKTLGIEPGELHEYVKGIVDDLNDFDDLSFLPKDKMDALKTYAYRHGTIDGITAFLDYELKTSKDLLETLYRTLEYHTGGIADYFIRPIHKMSNKTLVKLYNIIDKNIQSARDAGAITEEEYNKTVRWALIQIYHIQNNSQFINAIKTYKTLKG